MVWIALTDLEPMRVVHVRQMAMEGANPFAIQKALGHKDIKTTMLYVDMSNPHIRDQVEKLNGIVIPEEKRPKSAPNDISVEKRQEKGTRKKPDSLSDSEWCRRRDLNPHGFPHHPLKMALFARGLQSVRFLLPETEIRPEDYSTKIMGDRSRLVGQHFDLR